MQPLNACLNLSNIQSFKLYKQQERIKNEKHVYLIYLLERDVIDIIRQEFVFILIIHKEHKLEGGGGLLHFNQCYNFEISNGNSQF